MDPAATPGGPAEQFRTRPRPASTPLHRPVKPGPTVGLSLPAQYALAFGALALSLLVRLFLDPVLGDRMPFMLTLATLAALAWALSLRPYAAAILTGVLVVEYLFMPPRHSFFIDNSADAIHVGSYLVLAALVWTATQAARRHAARALASSGALRETDALLSTVTDGSATLLAYCDADLRYRFVNATYLQFFGLRREQVVGRTIPDVVGPAYERIRPHVERVLCGHRVEFEADLPYPTIGLRRVHVVYTPDVRPDGSVAGYTAAINDISQRHTTEQALRVSEERLRLATEATGTIVWEADLQTRTAWCSPHAAVVFGLAQGPVDELVARVHPDDRERVLSLEAAADVEGRVPPIEYRVIGPDGRTRWLHTRGEVVRDADGRPARYIGVSLDITERKLGEETAARFAAIIESTDDAVISKDLSGRIQSFNAAAERLYGYTAAEVLGRHIDLLIPPERHAEETTILERIRSGQRVDHLETVRVAKDGRRVDVSITVSPIRDAAGAIIGASKIARDISRRKQAEAQLRRSEERLRMALEAGRMGTWEWDLTSRVVTWSPGLEAIHGLAPGTFPGTFEAFQRDIHPDDRHRVLEAIASSTRNRADHHIEYRIIRPDGTLAWVEGRGRLSLDGAGEPVRMSGVCADVTERRLAEDALRDSEHRLRLALDAGQIGIHEYIPATGALLWDARLRQLFGVAPTARVDISTFWRVVHPDDRPAVEAAVGRATDPSRPIPFDLEYRVLPLDGSPQRWIHSTGQTTFSGEADARRAERFVGTARDITAAKNAAEQLARYQQHLEDLVGERTAQLQQSQNALRHAERMAALGTFAAGLGHDMSNLLLPIRARVESIEHLAGDNAEVREDAEAIKGSLRYVESMTRGLRLFAQDPEQACDGVTDVRRWCSDAEGLLRASLPKSLSLHCRTADDVPSVAVSPPRLSQAILNLVHNARDAITSADPAAAGAIEIFAAPDPAEPGMVRIDVRDDGPGMTEEVRARCIEPFFTTKARGMGGTGLGLAIAHGVAQRAGGRVHIDSAPGAGATVTLILPASPPAAEEPASRRPAFITISDPRTAAFAASLLAAMGREPIAAAPVNGVPADALWVTDATPDTAPIAAEFLAGAPTRRVIAIGGDDQWSTLGAITTRPAALPQLRHAFEQADRPRN